jgi:predicted transcriptional regulator of viral defense system
MFMSSAVGVVLVDLLAAEGRRDVSAGEVRDRLGLSAQAASNLLARLERDGLVERVRRGAYLLRPLGELGVAALASDRLGEAVVLAVGDRLHRICFRTALFEHGLLTRGGQRVQVAVSRRLFVDSIGGRSLESIMENPAEIHVGSEPHGDAVVSTVERALLESAQHPRRVGGIAAVAEALAASEPDTAIMAELRGALGFDAGLRRLVSLDRLLGLGKLDGLLLPVRSLRSIPLDPSDERTEGPLDADVGVRWPGAIDELVEVVSQ